ncbi:MAG TPA: type II secretion system protein [Sedimentisphaerales bacterium]|nr:type II secretion system protein [Sedimentisphaerales bacterium]
MKRKGFTLVELLVVIAIIALLMGILMPALARVRQLAFRMTCGTNLSGIGKAMLIYANDYEDELPRAGGRNATWGPLPANGYIATTRQAAYGTNLDGSGGKATISSCFYLLVKYAEVTPKSFVCKGDSGTTEFKLADAGITGATELIDLWDFGTPGANGTAYKSCSYAYHCPFGAYALTTSSEPGFAVAADRNPWIVSPAAAAGNRSSFIPDLTGYSGGTTETAKAGNALAHQLEGQNVLFLDAHVDFEKRSYCSIEDDNIYLISNSTTGGGSPVGTVPSPASTTSYQPANRKDSVLLHDPDTFGGTTTATRS